MAEVVARRHTLHVDNKNKINVSGVVAVECLTDREIVLKLSDCRLTIKGEKLSANKLSVEEGVMNIDCDNVTSLTYNGGKQKFNLKDILK